MIAVTSMVSPSEACVASEPKDLRSDMSHMTEQMAARLIDVCVRRGWYIACAESLTGGLLADAFVSFPGASRVFLGSAVTYHLGAKKHLLGVDGHLLASAGAVDPRVARQMAVGAARAYAPSLLPLDGDRANDMDAAVDMSRILALSTTGVAGPDSDGYKPVGLVYVGLLLPGQAVMAEELHLSGDRQLIRRAAVEAVLRLACEKTGA
jgi:nicotinamide-nucleotide amidase